jgi:hypothetical protein
VTNSEPQEAKTPSQLIDERIKELGGWRGKMLSNLRALIRQADRCTCGKRAVDR